jgi:hypothetical protein
MRNVHDTFSAAEILVLVVGIVTILLSIAH